MIASCFDEYGFAKLDIYSPMKWPKGNPLNWPLRQNPDGETIAKKVSFNTVRRHPSTAKSYDPRTRP
jgi:hypothetical protein